jgi:hypothetical protein
MTSAPTKEYARELLDRVAPEELPVVVDLLEKMIDPVELAQMNAPFEDEEISEEEELAAAESKEWLKHNAPIPMSEVLADFGLTVEDFERMGREPAAADASDRR